MSTLRLRTVGMSHILEGFETAELDGRMMLDSLTQDYGLAVAPMAAGAGATSALDGIIIDRKATSWDALQSWIEDWVRTQGCLYVSWADDGLAKGASATLHFHR